MNRGDEIKQIAYELWVEEDRPEGRAEEHWARAEKIWEERQKPKPVPVQLKPTEKRLASRRRGKQ